MPLCGIHLLIDLQAKVVVYKLGRISRSILDFANMMERFPKYGVEFASSTDYPMPTTKRYYF